MTYAQPRKLDEALALLAREQWTILSGGTDFFPGLGDQPARGNVLDIYSLGELRDIRQDRNYLRIGALVTWSDIVAAELPAAFQCVKLAAVEVGSLQIQNRATLVGNICNASPAADGVPPLLVLAAEVELVSSRGTRQLALADFIRGNRATARRADEMVSAILIPNAAMQGSSAFLKLGARKYLVISISMVAARVICDAQRRITSAAVSVGSCSLVAQRLPELEEHLIGKSGSSEIAQSVAPGHLSALSPIDDVRANKQYRLDASLELVKRALTVAVSTST